MAMLVAVWMVWAMPAAAEQAHSRAQAAPAQTKTQTAANRYVTAHAPLLGSAWYPEQWPESRWERDLGLMEQAHFTVVRVGEFAWSRMEPSEGHYDFGWLDRAIALAAKHHLQVVIGTPTDAPPAWLTSKYPQVLRVDERGVRAEHGGRRQFNYANPLYRQLCAGVDRQLALRYGHNPAVIGWQIGNEYTDESFDPATRAQFQQFLRGRYKSLANLNAHWSTAYWSQTYTYWSQIPMEAHSGNPGLLLEHKHFVTETWRSFQHAQINTVRPLIAGRQFITTNIGGLAWSDNWDHYAISADLNLASWDDYVGEGHLDAAKNAMLNDFVRGWKRQNFWVMETQPGFVNWAPVNNALAPGETRALAWQAVGHGADAVLYWQWRSALNGQEQYHGSIVGPDGGPQPLYDEVAQLGREFAAASAALAGTSPHADVALLHTYDSRWAIDFQPQTANYDQEKVLVQFYEPLRQAGAVDVIDPTRGPLEGYKLLVAPSLNVVDDALAAKLTAWIRAGGHLLLGPRSGMKDSYDALNPQRQPGPLAGALGAKVEQYYVLNHSVGLASTDAASLAIPSNAKAQIWAEALAASAQSARVGLRYIDPGGWLDGQPAMVTHALGRGSISYLGTLPDSATLAELLAREITGAGLALAPSLPQGVEMTVREDLASRSRRSVTIVLNHSTKPAEIVLPGRYGVLPNAPTLSPVSLTVGGKETRFTLAPQGVAVLLLHSPGVTQP